MLVFVGLRFWIDVEVLCCFCSIVEGFVWEILLNCYFICLKGVIMFVWEGVVDYYDIVECWCRL